MSVGLQLAVCTEQTPALEIDGCSASQFVEPRLKKPTNFFHPIPNEANLRHVSLFSRPIPFPVYVLVF